MRNGSCDLFQLQIHNLHTAKQLWIKNWNEEHQKLLDEEEKIRREYNEFTTRLMDMEKKIPGLYNEFITRVVKVPRETVTGWTGTFSGLSVVETETLLSEYLAIQMRLDDAMVAITEHDTACNDYLGQEVETIDRTFEEFLQE